MLSNKKSTIYPRTFAQYITCIDKPSITNYLHIDKFPNILFIKGLEYE